MESVYKAPSGKCEQSILSLVGSAEIEFLDGYFLLLR